MIRQIELSVSPEAAADDETIKQQAASALQYDGSDISIRKLKRSIDARGQQIKIKFLLEVYLDEAPGNSIQYITSLPIVTNAPPVLVAGAGPAGLFAAHRLIELGFKPIVLERGKDVRARRRDLAAINKHHIVNPESNYCFGEGGAGTYSDGKLYTRSKKRGNVRRVLEILYTHGAPEDILIDAHPHIGTNKLPQVVANLRESIVQAGGQVLFQEKITDLHISNGEVTGVKTTHHENLQGIGLILATGHSSRDMYHLLHTKGIELAFKPFAAGVRIEHQQSLIDQIQYRCTSRSAYLPPSSYSLVHQVPFDGIERGVFSFCMCPGGFIVPSATAQEEVVVNGMSPSRRDSQFANSGIVVAVEYQDLKPFWKHGALAGLEFQKHIERRAWEAGGKTQAAPAQNMVDFIKGKTGGSLLPTSYQPGLTPVSMKEILPAHISSRLQTGLIAFGQKMKGYVNEEAQIIGVESRTSAPVFIPRDKSTFEHIRIKRLFPCGEGAGFAGGIVSAAIDGELCAEMLVQHYGKKV